MATKELDFRGFINLKKTQSPNFRFCSSGIFFISCAILYSSHV